MRGRTDDRESSNGVEGCCGLAQQDWPLPRLRHPVAYGLLGRDDDWLTRKLGRLCFRIANWRQPSMIESSLFRSYLQAGCHRATFGASTELVVLSLADDGRDRLPYIYNKVSPDTVLVVIGLNKARDVWREIVADECTGITFDLYYCGIVLFDKKRHKQNYIVNF